MEKQSPSFSEVQLSQWGVEVDKEIDEDGNLIPFWNKHLKDISVLDKWKCVSWEILLYNLDNYD